MKDVGTAVVLGAGGFVGQHLVQRLVREGWIVRAVLGTRGRPARAVTPAHWVDYLDLCDPQAARFALRPLTDQPVARVYQLAAHMGGVGYINTGKVDAKVMRSGLINLNVAHAAVKERIGRVFFSSSACVYPPQSVGADLTEDMAIPASPDSAYGWEKLYSERLYQAYAENEGLDVRVARFHSLYGPGMLWQGGREKVPAALVRKILETSATQPVEVWGDGQQQRTYLYIDDALDAVEGLMQTPPSGGAVNIGAEERVTIDALAALLMAVLRRPRALHHIAGPTGPVVRGCSCAKIRALTGWTPRMTLATGMRILAEWIRDQYRGVAVCG